MKRGFFRFFLCLSERISLCEWRCAFYGHYQTIWEQKKCQCFCCRHVQSSADIVHSEEPSVHPSSVEMDFFSRIIVHKWKTKAITENRFDAKRKMNSAKRKMNLETEFSKHWFSISSHQVSIPLHWKFRFKAQKFRYRLKNRKGIALSGIFSRQSHFFEKKVG